MTPVPEARAAEPSPRTLAHGSASLWGGPTCLSSGAQLLWLEASCHPRPAVPRPGAADLKTSCPLPVGEPLCLLPRPHLTAASTPPPRPPLSPARVCRHPRWLQVPGVGLLDLPAQKSPHPPSSWLSPPTSASRPEPSLCIRVVTCRYPGTLAWLGWVQLGHCSPSEGGLHESTDLLTAARAQRGACTQEVLVEQG